jgi:hypothetical protein
LEVDRLLAELRGEDIDTTAERARLVKLTLLANVALSGVPALAFLFTIWLFRRPLLAASSIRSLIWLLPGIAVWGLALYLTGRIVVRALNGRVATRMVYRKGRQE